MGGWRLEEPLSAAWSVAGGSLSPLLLGKHLSLAEGGMVGSISKELKMVASRDKEVAGRGWEMAVSFNKLYGTT